MPNFTLFKDDYPKSTELSVILPFSSWKLEFISRNNLEFNMKNRIGEFLTHVTNDFNRDYIFCRICKIFMIFTLILSILMIIFGMIVYLNTHAILFVDVGSLLFVFSLMILLFAHSVERNKYLKSVRQIIESKDLMINYEYQIKLENEKSFNSLLSDDDDDDDTAKNSSLNSWLVIEKRV